MSLKGTYISGGANLLVFGGETVTYYIQDDSGKEYVARYYGGTLGAGESAVNFFGVAGVQAGAGTFTYTGDIDGFLGTSGGFNTSAGATYGRQWSLDGNVTVNMGGEAAIEAEIAVGYTWLIEEVEPHIPTNHLTGYFVQSDGTISKQEIVYLIPVNSGEFQEPDNTRMVTRDFQFIDGKFVAEGQSGSTEITGTPEEMAAQFREATYGTYAEALGASIEIKRRNAHEPEEPVVPPTTSNDDGNDGTSGGGGGGSTTIDPTTVIIDPADPVIAPPTRPWKPDEIDVTVPETSEWDDGFGGATIPIILDLDGDGVEVAFGEDIYFDLDDDGFLEKTSWASADDGFLVIDKLANDVRDTDGSDGWGDGVIDQSNELVLSSLGLEGDTDLQALARYDLSINGGNNNGKLDAGDAIWNELKVWQDLNQDGKTEGDGTELKTLAAWGISSINIAYDDGTGFGGASNDVEVFGNILRGLAVAA